jgi:DNA invertase Pin-like site-specific DNA recombinase
MGGMAQAKAFSYIRFSTPEQSKGHSLERQTKAARDYAKDHGLDLDERSFQDLGVSAFKGRNIQKGDLGVFLEAVREGAIPKGSYLLVESLDRLSRQAARRAANTIGEIVDAGITVVDLLDNEEYSADALDKDGMNFLMMVVRFMRANEESQRKSERLAKAWENKRDKASNNVPIGKHCPAWLKLNADRLGYSVIKERANVIKRIFDEAASGLGMYAITKRLNEKKVPHFGKAHGWRLPYVAIILKNRAVLGEFQPHKYIDGKRTPYGEPVKGYYPAIVDQELFDRVQRGLSERRFAGAGRKGKGYTSLFAGLLKCRHCESSVYIQNKGRNERYLCCANAGPHNQCPTLRWRYDHFEHSVLFFLSKQIDLKSILSSNREEDRRYQLDAKIQALEGSKMNLEKKFDGLVGLPETITDANAKGRLSKMLDALGRELGEVDAQLEQLTKERDILVNEATAMAEADIKALVESLNTVSEQDRYKARSDLASGLRKLVSQIDVGFLPDIDVDATIAELKETADIGDEDLLRSALLDESEELSFRVTFKNGKKEDCYPSMDDAFDPMSLRGRVAMEKLEEMGYDPTDPDKAMDAFIEDLLPREKQR